MTVRDDTLTHICPIVGGEVRLSGSGSRVELQICTGKGLRNRLTASLSPDDAERFFRRGHEIVPHVRAYGQRLRGGA